MLLTWPLHRRPRQERDTLLTAAKAAQADMLRQKEVQTMGQTIAEGLIEEGMTQGELRATRRLLRKLLVGRFGAVPEGIGQRIDGMADIQQVEGAVVRVAHVRSLDELTL